MSLTDLLVALAVMGLVLAANLTLLEQGRRAYEVGAARIEAQQNARIALTRMAREIRTAGSGTANVGFAAVSVAEPARIVIHRDVNLDGIVEGRRETVTWKLDRGVLRRDAGGGAQPIVNGVRALTISYFDAGGEPTTIPSDVRTVRIALSVQPVSGGPGSTDAAATVATQVRLRNR